MTQALTSFQKRTGALVCVLGDKERVEKEEHVGQMHTEITWGIFKFWCHGPTPRDQKQLVWTLSAKRVKNPSVPGDANEQLSLRTTDEEEKWNWQGVGKILGNGKAGETYVDETFYSPRPLVLSDDSLLSTRCVPETVLYVNDLHAS